MEEVKGVNLTKGKIVKGKVLIPDYVQNEPVLRVGNRIFAQNDAVIDINFGKNVKSVGKESFAGCRKLKSLLIPKNVTYLEEGCFKNCTELESVIFEGIEHIEKDAFRNCKKLRVVKFNGNCLTLEKEAFSGCVNMEIIAEENEVVKAYADENNIKIKKDSWLKNVGNYLSRG